MGDCQKEQNSFGPTCEPATWRSPKFHAFRLFIKFACRLSLEKSEDFSPFASTSFKDKYICCL